MSETIFDNLIGAPVTLTLMTAIVFVAIYQALQLRPDQVPGFIDKLAFQPRGIRQRKEYYRIFTSGFVHGGIVHLLFNLIALYFAGPLLERDILGNPAYMGALAQWGWLWYILLYFGSEMCAHAVTWSRRKNDLYYSSVGASGAISGVIVAFSMYVPQATILLFFILPMPAIVFAVLWIGFSFYAMKQAQKGVPVKGLERVAHEAHLGGAIGGLFLVIILGFIGSRPSRVVEFFLDLF